MASDCISYDMMLCEIIQAETHDNQLCLTLLYVNTFIFLLMILGICYIHIVVHTQDDTCSDVFFMFL